MTSQNDAYQADAYDDDDDRFARLRAYSRAGPP